MKKTVLVNRLVATTLLFFALAWSLPSQWPYHTFLSWLLTVLPVLLAFLLFQGKISALWVGLLPAMMMLVIGMALRFLPRTPFSWGAFLILGMLLGAVAAAQLDIAEPGRDTFITSQTIFLLTAYAMYLVLVQALGFAAWPVFISGLILFLIGGGLSVQILSLWPETREAAWAGWLIAFVTAQMGAALFYFPINRLFLAVLVTSLFYVLTNGLLLYSEKKPWGWPWVRILFLPLLWLWALWRLGVF